MVGTEHFKGGQGNDRIKSTFLKDCWQQPGWIIEDYTKRKENSWEAIATAYTNRGKLGSDGKNEGSDLCHFPSIIMLLLGSIFQYLEVF